MPTSISSDIPKPAKGGFFVGVTCPGCGGKLTLEDDFSILICSHCGSVLRVIMPEIPPAFLVPGRVNEREIRFSIDRFLKENNQPLTGSGLQHKHVYYPYWRLDAIQLKVRHRIEEKILNDGDDYDYREDRVKEVKTEIGLTPYSSTFQAGHAMESVPYTIGMRTQVVRMLPYSRDNFQDDYDALPVVRTSDEVLAEATTAVGHFTQLSTTEAGPNRTELLRPQISLVYFPYVIVESYQRGDFNRFVVDGLSARVLNHLDRPNSVEDSTPAAPIDLEFGHLDVDFHRCRNCGFDLPPVKSYVNVCDNCQCVCLNDDSQVTVDELLIAESDEAQQSQFYPFWSFHMGGQESARVRQLMGGIHESEWLTIPAFKIGNLEAMYRLSRRVSAALPKLEFKPLEATDSRFLPVTCGAQRAQDLANIVVFRGRMISNQAVGVNDINFKPQHARLLYVPFHEEHYFFVDSVLKAVTFERSIAGSISD